MRKGRKPLDKHERRRLMAKLFEAGWECCEWPLDEQEPERSGTVRIYWNAEQMKKSVHPKQYVGLHNAAVAAGLIRR